MVVAPRWQRTQQLMRRASVLLPLAAAYGFLLLCSWESDTFSLILPGSWEEGFKGRPERWGGGEGHSTHTTQQPPPALGLQSFP